MSSTSRMGNDPNPLGNDFNLFIPKFKILNLLIPDKDVGTSFKELLKRFKISIFSKFAMAGGNSDILLWLKVSLVIFLMVHNLVISSIWTRLLSLKSISAFGTPWASSNVFLTIFEVILRARCSFWLNYPSAACPHCSRLPNSESELSHAQRSAVVRFFKLTIADGASTQFSMYIISRNPLTIYLLNMYFYEFQNSTRKVIMI